MRKESLALLEAESGKGLLDIFYRDESQVSTEGYGPYGWQFKDEQEVCIESAKGQAINCFALISRDSRLHFATSGKNITAGFIVEQLGQLSFGLKKPAVVVLDNARVHTAKEIKAALPAWQQRGLYLFYLPPYCPHLNLAGRLWKEMKAGWIRPMDYTTVQHLAYAVFLALAAVGNELVINFSDYNF